MAKGRAAEAGTSGKEPSDRSRAGGNMLDLAWPMALFSAREDRDLSGVADLLRDPTVPMTQQDRDGLAELLCPRKRGAKVRGKLMGRQGRGGTAARDLALYEALEAYRRQHKTKRIPAAAKAEIAAQFGLLDFETVRDAEERGKAECEAEIAARAG